MSRDHQAEVFCALGKPRHTVPVTHSGVESVDRLTGTRNIVHRASMQAAVEGGKAVQQRECDDGERVEGEDRIGMVKVRGGEVVFRDWASKDDG